MSYNILAEYYDTIMNHVNYFEWYDLIARIIKCNSLKKPVSILEIGGGTGTLGDMLSKKRNIHYFGSDLCYNMAYMASKKKLPCFCADGRFLPVKKKFEMVIFLYDGINYLPTLSDYRKLFYSVATCLHPNGLFLFDITTRQNSITYFFDLYDYQEIKGTSVIRHSYYHPNNYLQKNDFFFFSPVKGHSNLFTKQIESHSQKIFKPEQIKTVIPESIFTCRGIWDNFSMNTFNENSERVHFLLQKKSHD
jgi:ubiquinone/menaquinone biosynthesis C-methylase UbiE